MSIIQKVMSIIYPPRCIFCNEVVPVGQLHCEGCLQTIDFIDPHTIYRRTGKYFTGMTAVVFYDKNFYLLVRKLKQYGDKGVVAFMGEELYKAIKNAYADLNFDFVTTIPMSKEKFKKLGFNHSALLSEYVAKAMAIPHIPDLLKREAGAAQHELNAVERMHNAQKSYGLGQPIALQGKTILLIDDIMTTGATLEICSKILLEQGATAVYCAVVAVSRRKQGKINNLAVEKLV